MNTPPIDTTQIVTQYMPMVGGIYVLLGLILWIAGIKVVRAYYALWLGSIFALVLGVLFVSTKFMGLVVLGGLAGLMIGGAIGFFAYRVVQGLMWAVSIGLVASVVYCQWQMQMFPPAAFPVSGQVTQAGAERSRLATGKEIISAGSVNRAAGSAVFAKPPKTWPEAQTQWAVVPSALRQRMLMLGVAVGVVVLVICMLIPVHVAWVQSATTGGMMLLVGIYMLIHVYQPQLENGLKRMPALTEGGVWLIVVLMGMLLQRMLFWPKRSGENENHLGELVAAR